MPSLSHFDAAALYRALLEDILEQTSRIAPGTIVKCVAVTPPDAVLEFERAVPEGFRVVPQEGTGLAERLSNLFVRFIEKEGFERVVVRNSDSPFLGEDYVLDAFSRLERAGAVFGPDGGGGYNLVGLKAPCPRLFLGIEMSTRSVLDETLVRAAEEGLACEVLDVGRDVDDPGDLDWLESELARGPERRERAPRTAAALARLRRG